MSARAAAALALLLALAAAPFAARAQPAPLAQDRIEIAGVQLSVQPAYQAVPKNTATAVSALFVRAGGGAGALPALPSDALVVGTLRGPGLSAPLPVSALPNQPIAIPPLAVSGVYTLDGIHLASGATTLFEGQPSVVQIEVVERVLVTQVSARALSADEIRQKGIVVDQQNFQVVNFTANFGIQDRQVRIDFPMLIPNAPGPNAPPAVPALSLPSLSPAQIPEARLPGLEIAFQTPNVSVAGLMLKIDASDEDLRGLDIPPLPAVIVIPGNVAYLNQFFSVMLMASNAAPGASQLVLRDLQAEIHLPGGHDTVVGTADDPLRMARLGSPPVAQAPVQPVIEPGADGKLGTADDRSEIRPGENGDAEFLVEGVREGGYDVEIEIHGTLDGLPTGPLPVRGKAVGLVEVRNPSFALTLSHPATVSAGEDYDLLVTVTNTSNTVANLVSVNLLPNSVSGARLVSEPTQQIDTLRGGEAATVAFRLQAQVTGDVVATSFSSDGLAGRFELSTAVGALGIPLSPNTLVLPRAADALPGALRAAAIGFLGQAFALATAPVAPAGLAPITRNIVLARARDLADAGQRVSLGEPLGAVARDLLFAFAGSDAARLDALYPDPAARELAAADLHGLDELLRRSERGRALLDVLGSLLGDDLASQGPGAFEDQLAAFSSGVPAPLAVLASSTNGPLPALRVVDPSGRALGAAPGAAPTHEIPFGADIALGASATLDLLAAPAAGAHGAELVAGGAAKLDLDVLVAGTSGLRDVRFAGIALAAGGRARLVATPGDGAALQLQIDADGDGRFETQLAASSDAIVPDRGPALLAASQIVSGSATDSSRFGNLIGLLFSEEITADSAQSGLAPEQLTHYNVDGNQVVGAQLQPGGRVVLLGLRDGIGPYVPRSVAVTGITDTRGNPLAPSPALLPIATHVVGGGGFSGFVRRGDGTPVPSARLRLSLVEAGGDGSEVALSVKDANADGSYGFDFVPDGTAHIEAVDRDSGESGDVRTSLRLPHQNLDVLLLGTGRFVGRALAADGVTPLAGAVVVATSLTRVGEQHGATTGADGSFLISGVPVGAFTVEAVHAPSASRVVRSLTLPTAGATLVEDLVLLPVDQPAFATGTLVGQVFRPDGAAPAAGVSVYTDRGGFAQTDAAGGWRIEGLPAGAVTLRAIDPAALEQGTVATTVVANLEVTANILLLGGTGSVSGTLFDADGRTPIANALVGGGLTLAHTAADGSFLLPDVPLGARTITALDPASGRTASADVTLLAQGDAVAVRLLLPARATLAGTVRDAAGDPIADLDVFLLGPSNVIATTDGSGGYRVTDLPLGDYLISAFLPDFSDGNVASARLSFANEVVRADVAFRGKGRVQGVLLSDGGSPLGGGVVGLTELRPKLGLLRPPDNTNCFGDVQVGDTTVELPKCRSVAVGFETVQLTRTTTSDLVAGSFDFPDVFVGGFSLQAGDRLSGDTVSSSGQIGAAGDTVDVVLQFPPNAREIRGTVFQPDGVTAVGAGFAVCLPACGAPGAIEVRTDASGRYLFQFPFVAGNLTLEALDDASIPARRGQAFAAVDRGQSAEVPIRLLGAGSADVVVHGANGAVAGAQVELRRGTFPGDVHSAVTGGGGHVVFAGGDAVSEGPFSVSAFDPASGARGFASGEIAGPGAAASVDVVLPDASGTVRGRFLGPDAATPIPNAQVRLSGPRGDAFATSDAQGAFSFAGVPLGAVAVEAFDPVTARRGRAAGSLVANAQVLALDVVAAAQGTVLGAVVLSRERAPLAGADVALTVASVFGQTLRATTGADGSFRFPGVSAGDFQVAARDAQGRTGSASGHLGGEGESVSIDVVIEVASLGRIEGTLHKADGGVPAVAEVVLDGGRTTTVDGAGAYSFDAVPLGAHQLRASQPGSPDVALGSTSLALDGEVARVDLTFIGTGSVRGTVRSGSGAPVGFAHVALDARSSAGTFFSDARTAGADGTFSFASVPVGDVSIAARDDVSLLAGSASSRLASSGQQLVLDVALEPSAALGGRVVREDGTTPAAGMAVEIVAAGVQRFGSTDADGSFHFDDVPVRPLELDVADPLGPGLARVAVTGLVASQTRDLGDVVLDESPPRVVSIAPADGAGNVPVRSTIKVVFSEPVDPASVSTDTLRVNSAGGPVAGALALADGDRRAVLTPAAPFHDFDRVTVRVTQGVLDRVGRPLAAEAVAAFTTADSTPPAITSRSPAPGSAGVTPDAVVRVAFSERIDPGGFAGPAIELRLGGALVPGRVDFALGDTAVIFTPAAPLAANGHYDVVVHAARDAFGNAQAQDDRFSFDSVDLLPPPLCALSVAGGPTVRAGTTASITADLSCAPDAIAVEFYVDGALRATDTAAPFELSLLIAGAPGATIAVAARARDAAGNIGPFAQLALSVAADAPPAIAFTSPADGSQVASGSSVQVGATASDDAGVAQIAFQAGGAATASRTLAVVPPSVQVPASFRIDVPADAPQDAAISVRALAVDTGGQASPEARLTLRVRDASPPSVAIAAPAPGTAVAAGATIAVRVRATDPSGVAEISLAASGAAQLAAAQPIAPAASAAEAVFQLTVPSGATPDQTLHLVPSARDVVGNAAPGAALDLPVADATPPVVTIATASGSTDVEPGASIDLVVTASDLGGVREIGFDAPGLGSAASAVAPPAASTQQHFSASVPANAPLGTLFAAVGRAVDRSGNEGHSAALSLRVADLTPPSVAIAAPADGAQVGAGASIGIDVDASDAFGVAAVSLDASGAATAALSQSFTPASPLAHAHFDLAVPADAPSGASIALAARARDASGNLSAPRTLALRVADTTPPHVVSVDPVDGATGVALAPVVRLVFSEPIDPATVDATSVTLAPEFGADVPASVTLSADGISAELTPLAPLATATLHRVGVSTAIRDLAGNALAAPFASRFTTASADVTGPRLLELLPADGATNVAVAPFVAARFDEALAPASVNAGALMLRDGAGAALAAALALADGGRTLVLSPAAPLALVAPYTVELQGTLTDTAGNRVRDASGQPFDVIRHAFTTGSFAIAAPADGSAVPEHGVIALEARASAGLGVASVVFSVNGVALAPVAGPPFATSFATPAAAAVASLDIVASGRGAGGAELARAEVHVAVQPTLRIEPGVVGVPLGGAGHARVTLTSPLASDLSVDLASLHPEIASVLAAPVALRAGELAREFDVAGVAAGATTLTAQSALGTAAATASVSTPESGRDVPLVGASVGAGVEGAPPSGRDRVSLAAPVGVGLARLPSAGAVQLAPGGNAAIEVLLLDAPAPSDLAVSVTSSDPAVASVSGPTLIHAGQRTLSLVIQAGAEGSAVLRLVAAGTARGLTVVVGAPAGAAPAPLASPSVGVGIRGSGPGGRDRQSIAPTVGIAIQSLPSAGAASLAPGAQSTLLVLLLASAAPQDLTVVVTSSDPSVARVVNAPVVRAGDRNAELQIEAGVEGSAKLRLTVGSTVRELSVVVGAPAGAETPAVPAPGVGVQVGPP